jgi:hypothetical protein
MVEGHAFNKKAFAAGTVVAIALLAVWHFVNGGKIALTYPEYSRFSDITFYVWPSSFLLIEVDPKAPLNFERATLYGSVVLINGLLYALVVLVIRGITRAVNRMNTSG